MIFENFHFFLQSECSTCICTILVIWPRFKFLWMLTSFLYKYFQLGQNSQSQLWQKCGFVHLLRLHFDFCYLCLLVCLLPPWLHFWLLWPPHLATWHLAVSAQIYLSANSAFYLFSPFSALVHEQTNFLTGFENIMFSLSVSWLDILRALPYQKLFVLNWCSVVWWPLKVLLGNKFEEHPSWIQSGRVLF